MPEQQNKKAQTKSSRRASKYKWDPEKWGKRKWQSESWQSGHGQDFSHQVHSAEWRRKRHYIFRRVLRFMILLGVLVLGGMAVASFLITRYFDGSTHTAALVWLTGCSLSLALPMMAVLVAMRGYRGFATPLANVMAAADAVAGGDLTARVPEPPQGEIGRLAKSFNHMATELERSDQQRRNLTADVAHELRTPLHIIQGNLEGILDGVYEATPEHINATLEETRSLARLVGDLRTLSLAEGGELAMVFEEVDLADILADIETSFRGQFEADGLHFECKAKKRGERLLVTGDPGRLDQVLSNLLVNARRHTSQGDTVKVVAKQKVGKIVIEVSDTGQGIPDEDLPYIFDRFWRGNRARSHSDGTGGGLGLAIVRQLVDADGGTIDVESTWGEGTVFQIRLPLVEEAPT